MKLPVYEILPEDFGVKQNIPLGKGLVLRVENDDWGYFVSVIDSERNRLYLSKLVVEESDLPAAIEVAKLKFA